MADEDDDVVRDAGVAELIKPETNVAIGHFDQCMITGELPPGRDRAAFNSGQVVLLIASPQAGDGDGQIRSKRGINDGRFVNVEVLPERRTFG